MAHEVLATYPDPNDRAAVRKEIGELDAHCRAFLAMCPFAVLSTASPDGDPDGSPRGGPPGFLEVLDPHTLVLPDRPGNNRLDSLRKVAENPRVSLLCMVPGIEETLRIHGRAAVRDVEDSPVDTRERGRPARSVLAVDVERAFLHCAKALMRSDLWDPGARVPRSAWPTTAEVLRDHTGTPQPTESQDEMRRRYAPEL